MQNTERELSPGKKEEAGSDKYLTFWTDGELFGIPISDVVQIISMQEIIPLPDFPAYAKGVINLRGNIIPVIDMRLRLKKPEAAYNENTCIIVTSIAEAYIGFIVDTVDEVADIGEEDISPAPKVSRETTNKYLMGIGQIGKKVVLLLDVSKILSESEFEQVSQTAQEQAAANRTKERQTGKNTVSAPEPSEGKSPDKKD
ncbi:MAG: chemotaxis protein CheW [Oscillospiraceae bacterium]|nr:chemotaxis protein CheW [Oscillospiraceae bacterium]